MLVRVLYRSKLLIAVLVVYDFMFDANAAVDERIYMYGVQLRVLSSDIHLCTCIAFFSVCV